MLDSLKLTDTNDVVLTAPLRDNFSMRRTRRKTSVIYAEQIQQALEACSIYPEHKAMLSRMYEELDKFLIGEFFVTPDTRRDIEGD